MKTIGLCFLFMFSVTLCWAQPDSKNTSPEPDNTQAQEPNFYDHYLAMQQMQERLSGRSLDDQTRLQPRIRRAERQACQKLREEREKGVSIDEYRRQGGNQFVAFSQDFERYCEMQGLSR